jgi:hypothetical protein
MRLQKVITGIFASSRNGLHGVSNREESTPEKRGTQSTFDIKGINNTAVFKGVKVFFIDYSSIFL